MDKIRARSLESTVNAITVDTLAWAYYRDGQYAVARGVARETLAFSSGSGLSAENTERAKASSRRLLALLDKATTKQPAK